MSKRTADIVIRVLTAVTLVALALAVLFYEDLVGGDGSYPAVALLFAEGDYIEVDSSPRIVRHRPAAPAGRLGMMIFVHGYNKAFRGGKLAGTGRWFESMGMRPGKVHATLAAGTEMGVGVLLVLGLLTQLAAAGLIALMVVAFWTVHRDKGFMITGEGWEYVALIAVMSLVTAILGPGAMSLDYELEIAHRLDGMTGLGIALLLGVGAGAAQLLLFFRPPKPDPAVDCGRLGRPPKPRTRRRGWLTLDSRDCSRGASGGRLSRSPNSGVTARRSATTPTRSASDFRSSSWPRFLHPSIRTSTELALRSECSHCSTSAGWSGWPGDASDSRWHHPTGASTSRSLGGSWGAARAG